MSNYPPNPPYPAPQGPYGYPYDPYREALAPARRAGVLQIVLSCLSLACGGCIGAMAAVITPELLAQQNIVLPPGFDFSFIKAIVLIVGGIYVVVGLLMLILGVFVIKGSKGAMIGSMVVAILGALFIAFNGIVLLVQQNPVGFIVDLGIVALLGWLIAWLAGGIGAANRIAEMSDQYHAQMYYQQQQRQLYGQAGFGPQQPWPGQQPQQWSQPPWPGQQPPQNPPGQV